MNIYFINISGATLPFQFYFRQNFHFITFSLMYHEDKRHVPFIHFRGNTAGG